MVEDEMKRWSSDLLMVHLNKIIDERDRAYQQRWEAQEKAVSAALSAAEKAVAAALIAQEKAVANAFNAQEKAVASALNAAERAVYKAEIASEKRFDSVNDFRTQMMNQVGRIDDLRTYKDTTSGKSMGINAGWAYLIGLISLFGGIVAVIAAFK